jgi:cardiolipin synthase
MLPNLFTIFRLVSCFVIIFLYIFYGDKSFEAIFPLYILAAITDYFDGKFARKYNQITTFGRCFDIIADKTLVLSILLIAMDMGSVHIVFVFIILFREFAVSGLREVLSADNVKIPASKLGKWKTGFQMTACGFAVGMYSNWATSLLDYTTVLSFVPVFVKEITFILFVITTILTLWSGGEYTKSLFVKKSN